MSVASQVIQRALAQRRSIVKAHSKRRRLKKVPLQRFPREAILSYKKDLVAFAKHLNKIVQNELAYDLALLFLPDKADSRTDATGKDIERVIGGIRVKIGRVDTKRIAEAAAGRVAKQVDTINRTQILKQFKSVLGIDITSLNPNVSNRLNEFIAKNVSLIQSIEPKYLADIQRTLEESAVQGLHVSEVQKLIEERGKVSEGRAELIARDQVGKLNGDLTKTRQENLGVDRFKWLTAQDERVRESHQDLEGEIFSWDDLPIVDGEEAFPGSAVQCRCVAEPLLDDILDDIPETEYVPGNLSGF